MKSLILTIGLLLSLNVNAFQLMKVTCSTEPFENPGSQMFLKFDYLIKNAKVNYLNLTSVYTNGEVEQLFDTHSEMINVSTDLNAIFIDYKDINSPQDSISVVFAYDGKSAVVNYQKQNVFTAIPVEMSCFSELE